MAVRESQDELLDRWFRERLKMRVPRQHVCANHDPPFEFLADTFYERYPQVIALACRNGGKSIGVAGLNLAEMSLKPNCRIVALAGNLLQASRGLDHTKEFLYKDKVLASKLEGDPLSRKIKFTNRSSVEILTASERSVHSPHVPKLRIDEVDLVEPPIYQGALSIPLSTPTMRAHVLLTSTRFKAYGMMFIVVEDAQTKPEVQVRTWCIREVLRRCDYRYEQCPMRKADGFCDGKWCKRATGFYTVDDTYQKFLTMDLETWSTQWLVEKPSRHGLVYDRFSDTHVVDDGDLPPYLRLEPHYDLDRNIQLDPAIRPSLWQPFTWTAGIDWGYEHPTVVLLCAKLDNDDVYVLDELYLRHMAGSEIADRVTRKFPMLLLREFDPTFNEHEVAPVYSDPAQPGLQDELQHRGMVMVRRNYGKIEEGIPYVRRLLTPPGHFERPKLFVHHRCIQLRQQLNRYHFKEETDQPEKEDDDGPDALRYVICGHTMPDKIKIEEAVMWTPDRTPISPDLDIIIPGGL